jgi:hypothetical protein
MTGSDAAEARMLLVLSVPRVLEERVIDWLLGRGDLGTFASSVVDLHGADPAQLRGAERVAGRQRRVQFQVHVAEADLDALTAALEAELGGVNASWFAVPLRGQSPFRG